MEIAFLVYVFMQLLVGKNYRTSEKELISSPLKCMYVFSYSFTPTPIQSLMQTLDHIEATRSVILYHTHLKNHISAYRVCRTVLKVKHKKIDMLECPSFMYAYII